MNAIQHLAGLTAPLFLLVLVGYALSRWGGWPKAASEALTRFVFGVAIPAFLFRLMSDFAKLPHVDPRLLVAFFGGCVVVFVLGRAIARGMFGQDGVQQSVFGVASVFSNTVLLGVPMAQVTLPAAAMPSFSLVIVFNSLLLWTLVTISVEWARHRDFSLAGFGKTAKSVVLNPVIVRTPGPSENATLSTPSAGAGSGSRRAGHEDRIHRRACGAYQRGRRDRH